MARGEFDLVDVLASPLFMLGALSDNNLIEFPTVMGWNVNDVLFSSGAHTEITWGTLLAFVALGVLLATNRPSISIYGGIQSYLVITTAGLVLAPPFVPLLEEFITHNEIIGFLAFSLQGSGYAIISWLG